MKLFLYLTFFCVLCMFYGMPIHIIRDVALTIRSFYKRITDFLKYRHATRDMNERYPDATEADIRSQDVCIICREGMSVWQGNRPQEEAGAEASNPIDERLRPKRLPCGHTLHFACLRSWLERQQNCPTCRQPVLSSNPTSPTTGQAPDQAIAGQGQAVPGRERENRGERRPVEQNRVRFFNLGPIRLGFGAGNDLRGLEQQFENRQALQPNFRNENVHQFGFSLGLGRPPRPLTTSSGQPSLQNMQVQLQAVEQQVMQDINSLQLQNQQLQVVRALQGELARLRIANSNNAVARAGNEIFLNQQPTQPHPFLGNMQHPQSVISALGANATQQRMSSGDPNLPSGVTIPDGWTLLPLQSLSAIHDPTMAQNTSSSDSHGPEATMPPTSLSTFRDAIPQQNNQGDQSAVRSIQGNLETSRPLDPSVLSAPTNSGHTFNSPSGRTERITENIPQWTFRPTTNHAHSTTEAAQAHDHAASSTSNHRNAGGETNTRNTSKRTTVEDAEDSDGA